MLKEIIINKEKIQAIKTTVIFNVYKKVKYITFLIIAVVLGIVVSNNFASVGDTEAVMEAFNAVPVGNYLHGLTLHDVGLLGREGNMVNPFYADLIIAMETKASNLTGISIAAFLSSAVLIFTGFISSALGEIVNVKNDKRVDKISAPMNINTFTIMIGVLFIFFNSSLPYLSITGSLSFLIISSLLIYKYYTFINTLFDSVRTKELLGDFNIKDDVYKIDELEKYKIKLADKNEQIKKEILSDDEKMYEMTTIAAATGVSEDEKELALSLIEIYADKQRRSDELAMANQIKEGLTPEGVRKRLENNIEELYEIEND